MSFYPFFPVLALITIWYLYPSVHKGEWDRRREERWKSWPSLFIHAPPLPALSAFCLCLIAPYPPPLFSSTFPSLSLVPPLLPVFLLLPLSSSVRASMALSFIWKPSRCVVCLIVRKCVWVCKMCFKVLRVRAFFFLASHTVPVSVATVCSVPVWDISFPQGRPGPFPLSAAANQPSSASIIY